VLRDPWSLLVLGEAILGNRRHLLKLNRVPKAGVASDVLSSRFRQFAAARLLNPQEATRGIPAAPTPTTSIRYGNIATNARVAADRMSPEDRGVHDHAAAGRRAVNECGQTRPGFPIEDP
jgi:hypothetical protein